MSKEYQQFFKTAQNAKASGAAAPKTAFKMRAKPAPSVTRARPPSTKVKQPFPWRAMLGMSLTLAGAGFYVAAPEICEQWYHSIEISAFGQASAKEEKPAAGAAEKSKAKATPAEKSAAKPVTETKGKNPDESRTSAEDVSHFDRLKQRKEELDMREKELSQLEEELQRQKVELDKRISQLEQMRSNISQALKDKVEVDQEKVTKLVDLYSNMKPKQAAEILGSVNEDLAVEVLAKMKKKNAAEIMNLLPSDKAKVLSEKYTGYRRAHDPKG